MPSRFSIAQARAQLPAIIGQAESGVPVELTRRGEPVAVLISTREFERLRGHKRHFSGAYQRFLATYQLSKIGVTPEFAAALRDRAAGRNVPL